MQYLDFNEWASKYCWNRKPSSNCKFDNNLVTDMNMTSTSSQSRPLILSQAASSDATMQKIDDIGAKIHIFYERIWDSCTWGKLRGKCMFNVFRILGIFRNIRQLLTLSRWYQNADPKTLQSLRAIQQICWVKLTKILNISKILKLHFSSVSKSALYFHLIKLVDVKLEFNFDSDVKKSCMKLAIIN